METNDSFFQITEAQKLAREWMEEHGGIEAEELKEFCGELERRNRKNDSGGA